MNQLEAARLSFWHGARSSKGTICQCCDRFGKVYVRTFNVGMARALWFLYRHAKQNFIHMPSQAPRHILTNNNVSKLEFWKLAERMPNKNDPTKNKIGWWRITDRGVLFIEGRAKILSQVVEYNQRVLEVKGTEITMSDALKKKFDYQALMDDAP